MTSRLRAWAQRLKREAHAVWLAGRDPRTPLAAKVVALGTAAYAFSPFDIIPDFIPVLGLLDDLILVPFGLWVAVQLIPEEILAEHRATAAAAPERPISRAGAAAVVTIWIALIALAAWAWLRWTPR